MHIRRTIYGYCQTQKRNHSVILNCIDTGMGKYLKGTVDCNYVRYGGKCDKCSVRDSYPNEFR